MRITHDCKTYITVKAPFLIDNLEGLYDEIIEIFLPRIIPVIGLHVLIGTVGNLSVRILWVVRQGASGFLSNIISLYRRMTTSLRCVSRIVAVVTPRDSWREDGVGREPLFAGEAREGSLALPLGCWV
jgi:hypothetical protein